ncbi:hypothetical protein [Caldimonas sp. KR1-144]|uniref:hypothetical protein n=1 Tax=Caldimonas sp. KR1-144 TaxID=3400911 RepID=UPI003C01E893
MPAEPIDIVSFDFVRATRTPAARKLLRHSEGDAPVIEQPIRMVSCDTPEKSGYAGRPELAQRKLDECRARLKGDFYKALLPKGLRNHLIDKLDDGAAARHIAAGERASAEFDALLERRLLRDDGSRRSLAVMPTGEMVDTYGRLLAYFAPHFGGAEPLPPRSDARRRTLNLDMVASGWAAFFPVYPSLPSNGDLELAVGEAEAAWKKKRGAWDEFGRGLLLAYEYRACIKLADAQRPEDGVRAAFQRCCVDLRSGRDLGPYGYWDVPPPYRLWYWQADSLRARSDLGLA